MNKLTIFILFILLIPSVSALQQTVGKLEMITEIGEQNITQYGLRNEENIPVIVKFNVTGDIEPYIDYPHEIKLSPNQFTYIYISSNIPSSYIGSKNLNGTIYALKEGNKNGQVQLNIRLGKNIELIVKDQPKTIDIDNIYYSFIIIGIFILILIYFVIYIKKHK